MRNEKEEEKNCGGVSKSTEKSGSAWAEPAGKSCRGRRGDRYRVFS
jgi:hypothetical protein